MVTRQLPTPAWSAPATDVADAPAFAVRETTQTDPPKPRLLDRVREALRARHYSRRTEEAYAAWIRRYILFHGKRHPAEMGAPEITRFLTALAVDGKVAASTQNQALSALLFLYRAVLEIDVPWLEGLVRARRPARLPVVLTRDEVRAVLDRLAGAPRVTGCLLYGAGLRLLEAGRASRPAAVVRDAPPGGWPRHPDGSGAPRPPRRDDQMIYYTHVLNRGPAAVRSPADRMFGP